MAGPDIIRIVVTVGVVQAACDILAEFLVFRKYPYKKALANLERMQTKHDKLAKEMETKKSSTTNAKQHEKVQKRLKLVADDLGEARAEIARRHSGPAIMTSVVFFILMRVLWTEHGNKVIGVLPFSPWKFLRRLTLRGLDFGGDMGTDVLKDNTGVKSTAQACAFVVIYLLSTLSVKFYVSKLLGTTPPPGADQGLLTVMESPAVSKGLRQLGVDPDEFKQKSS